MQIEAGAYRGAGWWRRRLRTLSVAAGLPRALQQVARCHSDRDGAGLEMTPGLRAIVQETEENQ